MNSCKRFECCMTESCIMYPGYCNSCVVGTDCTQCINRKKMRCLFGEITDIEVSKKNRRIKSDGTK